MSLKKIIYFLKTKMKNLKKLLINYNKNFYQ